MGQSTNPSNALSVKHRLHIAASYIEGARTIQRSDACKTNSVLYLCPLMHLSGMATEASWKCVLQHFSYTDSDLKAIGHDLKQLLAAAGKHIEMDGFIDDLYDRLQHVEPEEHFSQNLSKAEKGDPAVPWKHYGGQVALLNDIYNHPFQTRYPTTDRYVFPDPEVLLTGAEICLKSLDAEIG